MSNTDTATVTDAPEDYDEHTPPDDSDAVSAAVDADTGPEGGAAAAHDSSSDAESRSGRSRFSWKGLLVFGVLPVVVIALVGIAGYLKFQDGSLRDADTARQQSVQAATEGTIAMLSYSPDNVDATLKTAEDRLTGPFRDSYTSLVNDVVIPGAKQQKISATATVPAAASISATRNHAVVVVYVNQATIIGADAPTDTASVVEVTLDKVGDRWLISGFEPR